MTNAPIIVHAFNIPVHIGPLKWSFTGFGLAVFLAFLISQVIAERELMRRGFEHEAINTGDMLLAAIGGTLVGAKVYYVTVVERDWHQLFTRGGFVFWGGFIGAVIACYVVARVKKLDFARYADVAGIAISGGYAVGRTGCWAVGDDYGKPWNGFLAVSFPDGAPPSTVGQMMANFKNVSFAPNVNFDTLVGVIPTQLIEVALGFVMFLVAWRLRRHTNAPGWLFGVYCVMAGLERFLVEFLRIKDDRFFGSQISVAQMLAIAVALAGVVIMMRRRSPAPALAGAAAA